LLLDWRTLLHKALLDELASFLGHKLASIVFLVLIRAIGDEMELVIAIVTSPSLESELLTT
jgi:hypothetical protein